MKACTFGSKCPAQRINDVTMIHIHALSILKVLHAHFLSYSKTYVSSPILLFIMHLIFTALNNVVTVVCTQYGNLLIDSIQKVSAIITDFTGCSLNLMISINSVLVLSCEVMVLFSRGTYYCRHGFLSAPRN